MSYQALYRKYRPKSFEEIAGQEHITKTIKNALKLDRFSHAYIFSGPRGTGKTTIAKIIAKTLNCDLYPTSEPCGKCRNCLEIDKGYFTDIYEIDAASNNGVDEIREIRDKIGYLPGEGRYKVYIIDEVHMLTTSAFNALLKTLEEPPKHVVFILATTEIHKIPLTILSRCQRFDFREINEKDMFNKIKEISIKENIMIDDAAIETICFNSNGGLRDALSLFDQLISFTDDKITKEDVHALSGSISEEIFNSILKSAMNKDLKSIIENLDDLLKNGKEISRIIFDFINYLKEMIIYLNTNEIKINDDNFIELSHKLDKNNIFNIISILIEAQNDIKNTTQKRSVFELSLIKILEKFNENGIIEIPRPKEIVKKEEVIIPEIKEEKLSIKVIENILNNGNKNKKIEFTNLWNKIVNESDYKNVLLSSKVCAIDLNDLLLISVSSTTIANKLIKNKDKTELIKHINKYIEIKDILAISDEKWNLILTDYLNQFKSGITKPILNDIDLGIYVPISNKIKEDSNKEKIQKPDIYNTIVNIFGENNVKIKGE